MIGIHAIRFMAVALALLLFSAAAASMRANLDHADTVHDRADEPIYLPRAELLRPLSLGYHNVLADILWFRAINYFGKHYRSDRTYPWLAHICDLVTDLDPRAEHVYRFAGLILPWEAGELDAGIRLLEKGVRAIPESWSLSYYLGFNYFFFKNDTERAAAHLQRAARLPGVHPEVTRLAMVMTSEASGADTAIAFLRALEQQVDSQQVRSVIQRNLEEAAAAAAIQRVDRQIEVFERDKGRTPESLQELVAAGYLDTIPRDPLGGHFEIGPDGKARSSTGKTPGRVYQSPLRERTLQGKRGAALLGNE